MDQKKILSIEAINPIEEFSPLPQNWGLAAGSRPSTRSDKSLHLRLPRHDYPSLEQMPRKKVPHHLFSPFTGGLWTTKKLYSLFFGALTQKQPTKKRTALSPLPLSTVLDILMHLTPAGKYSTELPFKHTAESPLLVIKIRKRNRKNSLGSIIFQPYLESSVVSPQIPPSEAKDGSYLSNTIFNL